MYLRVWKRVFDLVAAFGLLVLALPLIGLVALAILIFSGRPVLFTQERVGRAGASFRIKKFRTMAADARDEGTVTVVGDPRVTPVGAVLRRWKLDELPQLWNVLVGDMSFVGPRPDVPGYADRLTGDARRLLELRPGVTGPATLAYRNEEAILAGVEDPVRYNDEVIYPDKVRINLRYLDEASLLRDLGYLWRTVAGT